MLAAILSIGDEIVLGQTLDTNGRWLAARLVESGVRPDEHRTVADDRAAIATAVRELASGRDLLLITGGLGPTEDDLTREALGDVVDPGAELVLDEGALGTLERWFAGRSAPMPVRNRVQAMRPPSARLIDNPHGTAPGLEASFGGCRIVAMPGPPREMFPMFDAVVAPALAAGAGAVVTGIVRMFGLGESDAAQRLGPLMVRDRDPLVGTTASRGMISARIRTERQGSEDDAANRLERTMAEVERAWMPYAYGRGDDTLAAAVLGLLAARGGTLTTAESCTGGWLGKAIVDEPGASAAYAGGWITYSNALKSECLGVPDALIEQHGAVSAEVACAMAEGARLRSGAAHALATTGVAGPDGSTKDKPVGTVYIGVATGDAPAVARRFVFRGDRTAVRERTVLAALQLLRLALLDAPGAPLLWERPEPAS